MESSNNNLSVRNPFDDSEMATIPFASPADLENAVVRAQNAFAVTRKLQPFERSGVLSASAAALAKRRDEFASLIVAEAGKPITFAEGEVDRAVTTLTAAAEAARNSQGKWLNTEGFPSGKGHIGLVRRFPIGVIYGITPFNFPLNLVMHKVAPAIAAGNAIIIKPSPRTPLTAIKLAELLRECGCPQDQVQVVVCPNELAMRLVEDDRIKMVSFTGSGPVGWEIKKRSGMKRITLELGGNAALIVHDDADLDVAIPKAANGAFGYAGQSCISVQRIFVQEKIYDQFRDRFIQYIRSNIRSGDPRSRETIVGPMIDPSAIYRVRNAIDAAIQSGGKLLIGGEVSRSILSPTVMENVSNSMDIVRTEIFGPVATLHRYTDFSEALQAANDSIYGLQAGVFTRDIKRTWQAFESLEVGGVLINEVPTWRSDTMPYGGVKQSGFGREGIESAMEEMTEPKTMIINME